jgi:hypothetical protein
MHAQELRRRAIAAVAKLSIFAGAAGCNGNVIVDQDDSAPDEPIPGEIDPGEMDPGQPPDIVIEPEVSICVKAELNAKCCGEALTKAFADDHIFSDPTTASNEEQACCDLAVTTMDTWEGLGDPPYDYQLTQSCCQTLVDGAWDKHPSCTPWGPPMPPRMPRRMIRWAVIS